jgi:hypothetical protein
MKVKMNTSSIIVFLSFFSYIENLLFVESLKDLILGNKLWNYFEFLFSVIDKVRIDCKHFLGVF